MPKKKRQFSQLPYALRLQIRRRSEIAAERESAATQMMMAFLEALHDNEKLGFLRLHRYGSHAMELIREFYTDRELNEDRLRRRLATLNIELERYAAPAPQSRRLDDVVQAERQDAAMVAMLVGLVAANDTLRMGADRLADLTERISQILQECASSPEQAKAHTAVIEKLGFLVKDDRVLFMLDADGNPVKSNHH